MPAAAFMGVFKIIDSLVFAAFDGLRARRREELAGCREAAGSGLVAPAGVCPGRFLSGQAGARARRHLAPCGPGDAVREIDPGNRHVIHPSFGPCAVLPSDLVRCIPPSGSTAGDSGRSVKASVTPVRSSEVASSSAFLRWSRFRQTAGSQAGREGRSAGAAKGTAMTGRSCIRTLLALACAAHSAPGISFANDDRTVNIYSARNGRGSPNADARARKRGDASSSSTKPPGAWTERRRSRTGTERRRRAGPPCWPNRGPGTPGLPAIRRGGGAAGMTRRPALTSGARP